MATHPHTSKQSNKILQWKIKGEVVNLHFSTIQRNTDTFCITASFRLKDNRSSSKKSQFEGDINRYIFPIFKRNCKDITRNRTYYLPEHISVIDCSSIFSNKKGSLIQIELYCYLKQEIDFSFKEKINQPEICELEEIGQDLSVICEIVKEELIEKLQQNCNISVEVVKWSCGEYDLHSIRDKEVEKETEINYESIIGKIKD